VTVPQSLSNSCAEAATAWWQTTTDRTRVCIRPQSGTNASMSSWAGALGYSSAQSTYVRYRGILPRPWMSCMSEEPEAYEFRYVLLGDMNLDADSGSEKETQRWR